MTPTRGLNKGLVVALAIELINQTGDPADLTLTALAGALNIQVPPLNNHIAGRRPPKKRAGPGWLPDAAEGFSGGDGR
jgi:hypothetical protein